MLANGAAITRRSGSALMKFCVCLAISESRRRSLLAVIPKPGELCFAREKKTVPASFSMNEAAASILIDRSLAVFTPLPDGLTRTVMNRLDC
jgi:hypothetical protein